MDLPLWPYGCGVLGALFVLSAWAKFRAPEEFRDIAAAYPLARWLPARVWASWVAPLEMALGTGLLSLQRGVVAPALIGSLVLLGVATWGVGWRLLRGERRFRCGCGSALDEESSAALVLLRNFVLCAVALLATIALGWEQGSAPSLLPVGLTSVGVLLGVALLRAAVKVWWWSRQWTVRG
jgi:hypothetical protein